MTYEKMECLEAYVKFSLENLKLFLALVQAFWELYPRKGFDRALARFARNLEVNLNNPANVPLLNQRGPSVDRYKLPKRKEYEKKKKKKKFSKHCKPEENWEVYLARMLNMKLV